MYRTLDDLKKEEKGNKKQEKDKKNPDTYAGGEKSGLAVEQPDDFNDLLSKAFDPKTSCKITLWSNGFQINDGEFRDKNEPQNQQFIQELKKGLVPQSLRSQYPQGLSVSLDDKTKDKYVPPPPPKYVEFSGSGVSLGKQQQQQQQQQPIKVNLNSAVIIIDKSKPTTTVQVRLLNGKIISVEVNLNTRVLELHDYVKRVVGTANIKLVGGYPPKALNLQQTIEEADLMDSLVNQTE